MEKTKLLLPLLFLLTLMLIAPVNAETGIDFKAIPEFFADKLNISVFAGGILTSGIVLLIVTLPVVIIVRGKNVLIAIIAIDFIFMGFCIALTWLPYYFLLIFSMLIALMFSGKIREIITGR